MAEYTQSTWRAILTPDNRVKFSNLSSGDSSYDESGPRPGIPAAQQDTEMTLEASGTQAGTGVLNTKAIRGGFASRTGAGFVWQQNGDTNWRGWDIPSSISYIDNVDPAGTTTKYHNLHAITLDDDQVVVCYGEISGGESLTRIRRMSAARSWGAAVTVYNHGSTVGGAGYYPQPCLLPLPDGRLLCFDWIFDTVNSEMQVWMHYSNDDGDTWSVGAKDVLPASVDLADYTDRQSRIRCAYNDGTISMFITLDDSSTTHDDEIHQFASDDLGASFTSVYEQTGGADADSGGYAEVQPLQSGGFIVCYVEKTNARPSWRVLPNAYASFSDSTETNISTTAAAVKGGDVFTVDQGDLATCTDSRGYVYAYWRDHANGKLYGSVTVNEGSTFLPMGDRSGTQGTWWSADTGTYPFNFCATFQRGRTLIPTIWGLDPATLDYSLSIIQLGGFSTLTMPQLLTAEAVNKYATWERDWCGFELPQDTGWTRVQDDGTGTESVATGGYLDLHATATTKRYYSIAVTPTIAQGIIAMAVFKVTSGEQELRLTIDDTTEDYVVEIRLDGSNKTLTLYDINAAASIDSAAIDETLYQQVVIALAGGACTAWYRSADNNEDREWTQLGQDLTCSDGGGGAGTDSIYFGALYAVASEGEWQEVHYCSAARTGLQLATGQSNPDDLAPFRLTSTPFYIDGGVKLRGLDGPCKYEDDWVTTAEHDFPVENMHPELSPSPHEVYRSSTTGDQIVAWTLDDVGDADFESDLLGVYVKTNAPYVAIQRYYDPGGGSSWSTLYSAPLFTAVNWTVAGQSLELSYHDTELILEENELEGCTFAFGEVAGSTTRTIARNTAGVLYSSGTYHHPRLYCDDITGAEAEYAAGTGTGRIYHPRALLVFSLVGKVAEKLRVVFHDAATVGGASTAPVPDAGYYECGVCLIGPIRILGWDPSATRSIVYTPNVEVTTGRDGRRRSRVAGPRRRRVEVAHVEGVDTSDMYGFRADHIEGSSVASAEPTAMRGDSPFTLRGLQEYLDGPGTPCVYIPNLPHIVANSSAFMKNNCIGVIYGRMTSLDPQQSLLSRSTEESTEVIRWGFAIEEEV